MLPTYNYEEDIYPGGVKSRTYKNVKTGKSAFVFQYPPREIGYEMSEVISTESVSINNEPIEIKVRKYNEEGFSLNAGFVDFSSIRENWYQSFTLFVYYGADTDFLLPEEAKQFGIEILQKLQRVGI